MNRLAAFLAAVLVLQPVLVPAVWAGDKKGDKLVADGRKAEAQREYDKALDFYEKAMAINPMDAGYQLNVRRVRFAASQFHVDQGQKLRKEGKLSEALAEFQRAYTIDPASAIAEQEMRRTYQMMDREKQKKDKGEEPSKPDEAGLTPSELARREAERRVASILPVPELRPLSSQLTGLKIVNQTAKGMYETVGKLAGINILFDAEYTDQKRFSIDFNNTTLEEALDNISLLTKTYFKPLSPTTVFVTQDNVTKRRDYEEQVTRVFYLQNLTSPQELQEVMTGMRTVTDVRKVFPINSQSAIVVRGTVDQVALAEKVLLDLDKAKPEVIVDVLVMEANKKKTRDLALTPISNGAAGISTGIVYNPGGGSGTVVGGTGSSSGSSTKLNMISRMTTGDWTVTVPGYLVKALMSDTETKIMTTPQVRATDGQKASLRLGQRYPYATGSFQTGVGSVGVNPLVSTQFQFAEVGINVDLTPRIHAADEVSMQVEFEISNISEKVDVGGLSQPVIGQRKVNHIIRVKEGEVTLIGGLMQANTSKVRSGVPGLMSIPGLKWLFSSESLENSNQDLVVALVPHIVRTPEVTPENLRTIASGTETIYKLNYAPRKEEPAAAKPGGPKTLPGGGLVPGLPAAKPASPGTTPALAPTPVPMAVQGGLTASPDAPGLARPSMGAATPVLLFKPSATEVAKNATVTVDLQIDNVTELFSAPMRLKYDSKVLKLTEVVKGSFLGGDGQQVTFSESKVDESGMAIVNMNRVPGAGGISGSGTLLTLKFQAVGPGVSPVRFEEVTLRDARLETIAVTPPAVAVTVK
ncbi:MAG: hypothetical protein HY821_06310 [Acidobacteria bacterium]|nr:hypothetical protein [Acidobacteriota bacterium]